MNGYRSHGVVYNSDGTASSVVAQGTPQVFEKSIQAESSIGLLTLSQSLNGLTYYSPSGSVQQFLAEHSIPSRRLMTGIGNSPGAGMYIYIYIYPSLYVRGFELEVTKHEIAMKGYA